MLRRWEGARHLDVDLPALHEAEVAYRSAAGASGRVISEIESALTRLPSALGGAVESSFSTHLSELRDGLSPGAEAMHAAAAIIADLRLELSEIAVKFDIAVARLDELDAEVKLQQRQATLPAYQTDPFGLGMPGPGSTPLGRAEREYASQLFIVGNLDAQAKAASKAASAKLDDAAEWAEFAKRRAFNHSAVGFVWNFGGGIVTGLWNTVSGLGVLTFHVVKGVFWDYTLVGFFDYDKYDQNWQNLYDGVEGLFTYIWNDPGGAGHEILNAFIPIDEWDDNPGKVIGVGTFEVLGLLVAVSKGSKVANLAKTGELGTVAKSLFKFGEFADMAGDLGTYGRILDNASGLSKAEKSTLRISLRFEQMVRDGSIKLVEREVMVNGEKIVKTFPEINGQVPLNYGFAGQEVVVNGMKFKVDQYGFPDFSPYAMEIVELEALNWNAVKGKLDRPLDDAAAETILRQTNPGWETPDGYTWHHAQDGHTLQLVPTALHNWSHTGGNAVTKQLEGLK